jgi:hypothetical protein
MMIIIIIIIIIIITETKATTSLLGEQKSRHSEFIIGLSSLFALCCVS